MLFPLPGIKPLIDTANKGAQTVLANSLDMLDGTLPGTSIDALQTQSSSITTSAASTTTPTSSSHPPPVHSHNGQPYNIHQRIRQPNGHPQARVNHSPSIRQSWLFPTNRASPSTALPETTSVMTLNHRPQSIRTETLTSTSASSATAQGVPPNVSMNHKERRYLGGSARTRLRKMSLNPPPSSSSLLDGSPGYSGVPSRRTRPGLQSHAIPTETLPSSSVATINPSDLSHRASVISINSHATSVNSYPRHIIMRSTSPHRIIDDQLDYGVTSDSLSSSLPSAAGFPPGIDISHNSLEYATPSNSEKASKHSSMPLPKPGWRLYDVLDVEESESQHVQGDGSGFGSSSSGEERNSFQYSASNASSVTNLDSYPYAYHAHTRQDSTGTFYTMTPNASNLDLSSGETDPSTMPSPDSNLFTSSNSQAHLGQVQSPALPPPLPKAIKITKSPLALRRSSTISSMNPSSPSNTYLSKGSFPKSSLSSNMTHSNKILTMERQKIILEILKTERSYVDGLVILQTCFYEPLNAPYSIGINSGMNTTHSNLNGGSTVGGEAEVNALSFPSPTYNTSSTMGFNSTLAASAAPLLSKRSVGIVFSNFLEILQINIELLTQLETRICGATLSTGWESEEEKEGQQQDGKDDHVTQQKPKQVWVTVEGQGGEQEELLVLDADWCIGDIFVEIAPFLKMYSNYVKAFESALTHVNECMKSSDRFTEFLKATERRPECKKLDFQAYFMLPIQRIPRYKMLLESLLRHTPADHPDYRKLLDAFKAMEQTAGFVNETIRQHEMFGQMINLQSKITGMSEQLVRPGRVLLKRGRVSKVSRRNIQLREIILLSDCILWMSPSMNPLDDTLVFHRKVGLENCTVIGAEDPDPTKNAFQIMSSEKSSQVFVDTAKEKEDWIAAIRIATQEYLSAKRTLKPTPTPLQNISDISSMVPSFDAGLLRRDTCPRSPMAFGDDSRLHPVGTPMCVDPEVAGGGMDVISSLDTRNQAERKPLQPLKVVDNYNAPVWKPDHSVTRCMICTEEFGTIFRRRHHCRICGNVVCHSCSSRNVLLKGANYEKVGRACDGCFGDMFPEEFKEFDPVITDTVSPESSPVDQQQQQQQPPRSASIDHERRASNYSLDGVMIRAEDYSQESYTSGGATGMVRGIVEAGLNRMKSRTSSYPTYQDNNNNSTNDVGSKENSRASNRKSDSHLTNSIDYQNGTQVKECGLCKTEFGVFKKWKNTCSQCRRVVCSDCLTKKQIDQLFLLGLQAEREAKARGMDANAEDILAGLALQSNSSDTQDGSTRPGINQSMSENAVETGTNNEAARSAVVPRSQSFNNDTNNSNGGGYGSFGNGWRAIKGNTDSGHGQAEKLCDPCYLGLSADQIKVLESGGGWEYYQATLGRNQAPGLAAALALSNMSLEDDAKNDNDN